MTHSHHGGDSIRARIAVLTVSDTRTEADDLSGAAARRLLEGAGHEVHDYRIVADEPDLVRERVQAWLGVPDCDGVIASGGTGISARDRTFEALVGLLERRLDGFGELFRMLSFEQIGSAAMLSRAVGGVAAGKLLFSLPGSTAAVELGLERLILPELGHLLSELRKHRRTRRLAPDPGGTSTMSSVTCSRCGNTTEGLERAPLPGDVGQALAAQTCAECWGEWLGAQVILINERSLTPANPEHYDQLVREMKTFLNLRDGEDPAGPA